MNIDELDFTVRTYNCLRRAGIDTIEKLQTMPESKLLQVKNLNQKCINEIKEKLRRFKPPDFLPLQINCIGYCKKCTSKDMCEKLRND